MMVVKTLFSGSKFVVFYSSASGKIGFLHCYKLWQCLIDV